MPRAKKRTAAKTEKSEAFNKAAFIREHSNLEPPEIVDAAKKKGQTVTIEYVYSQRSKDKSGRKRRKAAKGKPGPKPKAAASSPSNGAITDFYRVLKKVGVAKAKELIANIEAFQNA